MHKVPFKIKEAKENNQIVSRDSRESYSQKRTVTQREENISCSIYTLKIVWRTVCIGT